MNVFWALILAAVLPAAGTQFKQLPAGTGKAEVETACFTCHSADLLAQQRLNEKQWTAAVEKMMRWGANVPPEKKSVVIAYLLKNFGPANKFSPTKVKTGR
jgi:mono/diheme cytochrome c family protein